MFLQKEATTPKGFATPGGEKHVFFSETKTPTNYDTAGLSQRNLVTSTTAVTPNTPTSIKSKVPPPRASIMWNIDGPTRVIKIPPQQNNKGNGPSNTGLNETQLVPPETTTEMNNLEIVSHNIKNDYCRWIVVYGFPSVESQEYCLDEIFSTCGTVEQKFSSSSNWMAVQYTTRLEVEKALCCHEKLVSIGTKTYVLGVRRVTPDLANQLEFLHYCGASSSNTTNTSSNVESITSIQNERDILLSPPPKIPKNHHTPISVSSTPSAYDQVYEKVLSWVFA